MKASFRALAAKFRPAKNDPAPAVTEAPALAPVAEADDTEAYSSAAAEVVINQLVDQLEAKQAQMAALVKVNHELTAQLSKATATLKQFYALPRNKYWSQRSVK